MKRIKLGGKLLKYALVDDADFEYLNQFRWQYTDGYARRDKVNIKGTPRGKIHMHRVVMNTPLGMETDHINGDKCDNRKSNLRICTKSQNNANRGLAANNTSGYKGVTWDKNRGKWFAQTKLLQKKVNLGYFDTKEEAALAYNEFIKENFGSFARLNEVSNG